MMKDEMANGFCHLNNKACVFTVQDNIFGIKNIHHIFSGSQHGWMVTLKSWDSSNRTKHRTLKYKSMAFTLSHVALESTGQLTGGK